MRVRITFNVTNGEGYLPFYHQNLVLNTFSLLFEKNGISSGLPKSFTFSSLKGSFQVTPYGLKLESSKLTLILSGSDFNFIDKVRELIFKEGDIQLGSILLTPIFYNVENSPSFQFEMKYICLSQFGIIPPSLKMDNSERFVNPLHDSFSDLLYYSTMERLEETGQFSADELESFSKFQIVPEQSYIKRFEDHEEKYSRIYNIDYNNRPVRLRGYIFPFTLYADPKVQEYLYYNGLGVCTEKGWGALDIIKEQSPDPEILSKRNNLKKRENVIDM